MIEVAITDVCDFQGGSQPPKSEWSKEPKQDYIRMLQIRDFTQGKDSHIEYIKYKKKLKTCNSDDILIGRYGASIGKILTGLAGAYNVALVKTIPNNDQIDRSFLLYLLKGKAFQQFILNIGSRAAQAGFNKGELTKFRFNLPSLPEQQKIACILDAADSLRQKDQQLIKKYTALSQSLFLDMFGDPVTNPMGWETIKLEEIADIVSGVTKGRKLKTEAILNIPYMRVANVQDGRLNLQEIKTIPGTEEDIKKFILLRGDVLLTEGGDPDKLGRGTVWNNEVENCIHQNHIFRVRLTCNKSTPIYLSRLCGSEYGKRYFLKSGKQTTGIASINKTQLRRFPVLRPPIELQNQFAERIQAIEAQKQQAQASLQKSEDLFNSLLQRAFKGELTH